MKKFVCMMIPVCIVFTLAGCRLLNAGDRLLHAGGKNRDDQGYIQFIAEFNTGLFAYTNSGSGRKYTPSNPKLRKEFAFGDKGVVFSAQYAADRIIYTVINPTADRTAEKETFAEIFNIYSKSWNYYCDKTDVGCVSSGFNGSGIQSLELIISGEKYKVSFFHDDETPKIIYEIIETA